LGVTQAERPLTNAEVFRLKGWYWRRILKNAELGKLDRVGYENSGGTIVRLPDAPM
jgi:hypothetical protein